MKLKRHLPRAPFPPTLPVREDRVIATEHGNITEHRGSPLDYLPPMISGSVTKQTAKNSHAAASAEKKRRWGIVLKMALEGSSNEEIMKATGYKTADTVKSIVHQMRKQGIEIPERRRGCKKQD